MNEQDKKEIEKLKSFKKWYLWFLSASEEEKKEYLKNRWKTKEERQVNMTFIKDYEITEELHGSESFEVIIIYHRDGTIEKFYVMPK